MAKASIAPPSKPTRHRSGPAVRLALAWLSINGIVEGWQIERFWTCLTKSRGTHDMDPYCRTRDVQIYLNRWKLMAGGNARR